MPHRWLLEGVIRKQERGPLLLVRFVAFGNGFKAAASSIVKVFPTPTVWASRVFLLWMTVGE